MSTAQQLRDRLSSLNPIGLTLTDDSALHAGHAGSTGGGHFSVTVVSEQFVGLSRLARQRLVLGRVGDLIPQVVHALSIKALAPNEALS